MTIRYSTIVCAAIGFAALLLGFLAGVLFYETQIQKAPAANIWDRVSVVVGLAGILIALGVATWSEISTSSRYKAELDNQNAERQRYKEIAREGMINELLITYQMLVGVNNWCIKQLSETDPGKRAWDNQIVLARPIFEKVGPELQKLDPQTVLAIAACEAKLQAMFVAMNNCFYGHKKVDYEALKLRSDGAAAACLEYLQVLKRQPGADVPDKQSLRAEAKSLEDTLGIYEK